MPSYRSITVSLVSQYDVLTIPEYPPASDRASPDPFVSKPGDIRLIDQENSLVTVYVPVYPSSQFWIVYSISPPYPPNALFYFKLFLNDKHVVSLGCGEPDGYKGKMMFNMEPRADGSWERQVLCFSPGPTKNDKGRAPSSKTKTGKLENKLEIKVYRAKTRRRVAPPRPQTKPSSKPQVQTQTPAAGSVNFVSSGPLSPYHPKKFYKYLLLEPITSPFATFRYLPRSWDELEALNIIPTNAPPSLTPSSSEVSIDITAAGPNNHTPVEGTPTRGPNTHPTAHPSLHTQAADFDVSTELSPFPLRVFHTTVSNGRSIPPQGLASARRLPLPPPPPQPTFDPPSTPPGPPPRQGSPTPVRGPQRRRPFHGVSPGIDRKALLADAVAELVRRAPSPTRREVAEREWEREKEKGLQVESGSGTGSGRGRVFGGWKEALDMGKKRRGSE